MLLTVSGISYCSCFISCPRSSISVSIFHTDPHHSPPNSFSKVYTAITNLLLRSPDPPWLSKLVFLCLELPMLHATQTLNSQLLNWFEIIFWTLDLVSLIQNSITASGHSIVLEIFFCFGLLNFPLIFWHPYPSFPSNWILNKFI